MTEEEEAAAAEEAAAMAAAEVEAYLGDDENRTAGLLTGCSKFACRDASSGRLGKG